MISLAEQDETNFYKLALIAYENLQKHESFDLTTIFNESEFEHWTLDLSKSDDDLLVNNQFFYDVAVVHVTPSSIKVMPYERILGNRVLRQPDFSDINEFCLVYFKPDKDDEYIKTNLHYEVVLKRGILLCNRRYYLFGASNSQLQQHSYWFIRADSYEEVDEKRAKLGDFSGITNVGKYITRLGLWFSKTMPSKITLKYAEDFDQSIQNSDYCVTMIDDIKRNDYCFTDGNGFISKGLAKVVAKNLGYPTEYLDLDIYPSAYQIRMAGCKGLVVVEPKSTSD
ncbi:unnamed protein product [Rotaria sp. Silwood1]|nr:unnamed protein product [Rotaria sp. Silwood1]CAF1686372.1 unnamed protein product [Rotaria sp. Silwood1]CAF3918108.1 unnamed protein product [Rotaria sp. Silwood1]CAF5088287.1 unnamed protein product [Rotaria sp. Silwood1]